MLGRVQRRTPWKQWSVQRFVQPTLPFLLLVAIDVAVLLNLHFPGQMPFLALIRTCTVLTEDLKNYLSKELQNTTLAPIRGRLTASTNFTMLYSTPFPEMPTC